MIPAGKYLLLLAVVPLHGGCSRRQVPVPADPALLYGRWQLLAAVEYRRSSGKWFGSVRYDAAQAAPLFVTILADGTYRIEGPEGVTQAGAWSCSDHTIRFTAQGRTRMAQLHALNATRLCTRERVDGDHYTEYLYRRAGRSPTPPGRTIPEFS